MKKFFAVVMCIVLIGMIVTGCSQNSETPTVSEDIPVNTVALNYDGKSLDNLEVKELTLEFDSGITDTIAFYGKAYDVEVGIVSLWTEDDGQVIEKYDELENTVIVINESALKGTSSNEVVMVSYYDEDLNHYSQFFGNEDFMIETEQKDFIKLLNEDPSVVAFFSTEHAIKDTIKGGDEDFSALVLVDDFDEYVTEGDIKKYLYLDENTYSANYMEEDQYTRCIPIWVSANMKDILVKRTNWGEVMDTYVPVANIKAGSWLRLYGQWLGDASGYDIEFTLDNGSKKVLSMYNDESDNINIIPGLAISISDLD